MDISIYLPVWEKLTAEQQQKIASAVVCRTVQKGEFLHRGEADCTGFLVIRRGQLRAFSISDDGREITLYRLFERDLCLLAASCMMRSMQSDVTIQAEKESEIWIIPPDVYKQVMEESAPLANYTNEIIASRFSVFLWMVEQVLWKSFDKRLAAFLLEEAVIEGTNVLKITHEIIGNHLGNPREVVTRMLRYFQSEGWVSLSRGMVEIVDEKGLRALCE